MFNIEKTPTADSALSNQPLLVVQNLFRLKSESLYKIGLTLKYLMLRAE